MLVGLFRKMNPVAVGLTILICLIPWLVYFSDMVLPGEPMPLYVLLTSGFTGIGKYVLYFLGAILILLGGSYVNYIINQFDASEKRSQLPGLFYVLFMCLFPEWILFHPVLIVNIIALHILAKVLRIYRDPENLSLNFDIGIFVGLAAMFYFPAIYLLLFYFGASFVLRPFYWRDWASTVIGLIVPYFVIAVIFFLSGRIEDFNEIISPDIFFSNPLNFDLSKKINVVVIAIILTLSCISIANYYFKSITVTRKTQIVVLVFMGVSIIIALLSGEAHPIRYTVVAAPVSILFTYYVLNIRNRYLADTVIAIVLCLLLFNHIYVLL